MLPTTQQSDFNKNTFTTGQRLGLRLSRLLPFAIGLAGLAALVWALSSPQFRNVEGFPRGTILLPIAVGIALLGIAWAWRSAWRTFSFWFALGLVGQAVTLQLIDAGTAIHYQHYLPPAKLAAEKPLLVLFVLAQTVVVTVALARRFGVIRDWVARTFRLWQIVVVAAILIVSAAALSRNTTEYAVEVLLATGLQLLNLGTLALMLWALPADAVARVSQRVGGLSEHAEAKTFSLDWFAVLAAAFVTVVAALLAYFSYEQHPHLADEVAYLLHARFLAAGNLTLPAPPVPQAFEIYLMQFRGGEWFAVTPPGWPAMLALGVRLGAAWLVNPLLAGVCVLLTYLLVQELYDRKTARWVVLLLCASPWFLLMSMNFMTHTFTLTCALAAAVLVGWAKRQQKMGWAFLAGGFVGAGSLIRPLDGLMVAALLGLWLLGVKGWRTRIRLVGAFVLGAALVGAVVLPYNAALAGKPTVFPLNAYLDEEFGPGKNDLGFGENRGYGWALQPFPGHSPLGAVVNTILNLNAVNTELFGWSSGSLLFVALFLACAQIKRNDWLMLAAILATIGFFAFYWYSGGPDFGARYWYIILIPCIVLTVRGAQALQTKLASHAAPNVSGYLAIAFVALALFGLVNYVPWRALDKYHHYLAMRPDIQALAQENQFGTSLVLIRGEAFPDYAATIIYNPLEWNAAQPIYAWARNEAVTRALLSAYPDRAVWIVDGPSRTQSGYRIVAGPLASEAVRGLGVAIP